MHGAHGHVTGGAHEAALRMLPVAKNTIVDGQVALARSTRAERGGHAALVEGEGGRAVVSARKSGLVLAGRTTFLLNRPSDRYTVVK